jgi:uncharacterized membrane protein (DUF106 family)
MAAYAGNVRKTSVVLVLPVLASIFWYSICSAVMPTVLADGARAERQSGQKPDTGWKKR